MVKLIQYLKYIIVLDIVKTHTGRFTGGGHDKGNPNLIAVPFNILL